MTVKLIVDLSDDLNQRLKKALIKKYGFKKGIIKHGVTEALEQWMARQH